MKLIKEILIQKKIIHSIDKLPIEYFKWGTYPDHFKIDMPHRHEFSELLFFIKGEGIHEIDFEEVPIKAYSIHFIPKSTVHFLKRSHDSLGFTIAMDGNYLGLNQIHKIISPLSHKPFVVNLKEKNFEGILKITDLLQDQIKWSSSYFKEKCFLLSLELLLNRIALELKTDGSRKVDDLLTKFQRLLQENIYQEKSVSWYAMKLNISPKYLSNYIKTNTGKSAKFSINNELLKSVKRQLINTDFSIKRIAFNHNVNVSNLGKLFKKHVGYTMKAYRTGVNVEN